MPLVLLTTRLPIPSHQSPLPAQREVTMCLDFKQRGYRADWFIDLWGLTSCRPQLPSNKSLSSVPTYTMAGENGCYNEVRALWWCSLMLRVGFLTSPIALMPTSSSPVRVRTPLPLPAVLIWPQRERGVSFLGYCGFRGSTASWFLDRGLATDI